MKVSELLKALRDANPDAVVNVCVVTSRERRAIWSDLGLVSVIDDGSSVAMMGLSVEERTRKGRNGAE
jgi:hypothetical protein